MEQAVIYDPNDVVVVRDSKGRIRQYVVTSEGTLYEVETSRPQ